MNENEKGAPNSPGAPHSTSLTELLQRLPHVRAEFITEVMDMPPEELRRRVFVQADWIGSFGHALDGLPLDAHGYIRGSGIDGARTHHEIRRIVEGLLEKLSVSTSELRDLCELRREVIAILDRNENAVRMREGDGPENLAQSIAVTVAKLQKSLDDTTDASAEKTIEIERLYGLINSPQTADFLEAVKLEAAHQRERWGTEHDAGKTDVDWLFLAGYLGGKAVEAGKMADMLSAGDMCDQRVGQRRHERRLHHIVAAGAAILNWHAQRVGVEISAMRMRPGIMPPLDGSAGSGTQLVQNAIDNGLTKAAYDDESSGDES